MVTVNIRELTHNFANYLKKVKSGERLVIMERNTPVADVIPHNENIIYPGWKRKIEKITLKGENFSETIVKNRREENR